MPELPAAYRHISDFTESLLPYPTIDPSSDIHPSAQANANRQCAALAEFWQSEAGQDWKTVILAKVQKEISTPELRQWWEDFNSRYPVTDAA